MLAKKWSMTHESPGACAPMTPMKRKRHTTEKVIRKLRTVEEAVTGEETRRIMAVSMATCEALAWL